MDLSASIEYVVRRGYKVTFSNEGSYRDQEGNRYFRVGVLLTPDNGKSYFTTTNNLGLFSELLIDSMYDSLDCGKSMLSRMSESEKS